MWCYLIIYNHELHILLSFLKKSYIFMNINRVSYVFFFQIANEKLITILHLCDLNIFRFLR